MQVLSSKLINFKSNIYFYLVFIFFFFVFFWMSYTKAQNFGITYYDTGYYANILENNLYEKFKNNHLSYILIPLSIIINILPWNTLNELIFIQVLAGLSPILFLKKNKFLIFVYILCPIVWFNVLPNFHIDILVIPVIWLMIKANDEKKFLLFFVLSILLVSIKIFFFSIILGFILYNFFDKKNYFVNKKYLYLITLLIIYFSINFFYNFNLSNVLNELFDLSYISNNSTYGKEDALLLNLFKEKTLNIFIFLIVVFGYFLFYPFLKNNYILIILPTLSVYFLSTNNFNLSKFYYHYTAPLIPVLFYSINESLKKKILFKFNFFQHSLKKLFLLNILIFNVFFSPSPISVMFWLNFNDFYFKSNYIIKNSMLETNKYIEKFVKEIDKKNIVIENNLFFNSLLKHNIQVFPNLEFSKNKKNIPADYIFLRNKDPRFINGERCKMLADRCADKIFLQNYQKIINNFKNYSLLYEDLNIKIFKHKN